MIAVGCVFVTGDVVEPFPPVVPPELLDCLAFLGSVLVYNFIEDLQCSLSGLLFAVAIDCRVDTRFALRAHNYARTAHSILKWQASDPIPALYIFFPSFEYAHAIKTSIDCIDPYFRIALQPRGTQPDEQADFLEYARQQADAIFFITGSVFAEGIDTLGAAQSNVMVVSPALAEISAVTKAKMEGYAAEDDALAFHELCLIPAMRKIQQALGRFVRQPGESARVLLHCQRFAETQYQALLQDSYPAEQLLHDEAQFEAWLIKKKTSPNSHACE